MKRFKYVAIIGLLALCGQQLWGQKTFKNPILSGMNPDPSICRVGDDFYLINSTFEYFPGLPIYHSKDLVHWKLIGHVLSTKTNNPLMDCTSGTGGQYAPTLRYCNGTFYVTCTNYTSTGTKGAFYVKAQNITGPWSDPVWVGNWYVDPSPTFVGDSMYYLTPDNAGSFMLGVIDRETDKFTTPVKKIAAGLGGASPEGPHLYKINDYYYLMSAEGGTGYEHREVIQRSKSPWGPYTASPINPVASNMNVPEHPFQAIGHADLVQLPDNSWWLVCLGYRPQGGRYHHLGRETFLAPVTWNADGWPKVGTTGVVGEEYPVPNLPEHVWEQDLIRDDFDSNALRLSWNVLRNPDSSNWSLTERTGFLRLYGKALSFREKKSPAFIGRRQTAFDMLASAKIDFTPAAENEEAGLVVRGDDKNHYDFVITKLNGKRVALLRTVLGNKTLSVRYKELNDGAVTLRISSSELYYRFWVQDEAGVAVSIDSLTTKELSTEKIGGFTGTYIGMYASGNGKACTTAADFDWFDFEENPSLPFSWASGDAPATNGMLSPEITSMESSIYYETNLSWTNIDSETSYRIERLNETVFDSVGTCTANNTTFTDNGLTGNTMYTYRVLGRNAQGLSAPSIAKSIITKPKPGPYTGTPYAIPGKIEAENYDYGDRNVAFYDADAGNKNGAYRSDDVDVEICWDAPNGYDIGWIENGEWLTYTVDVNDTVVDVNFRVATEQGGTITAELDGKTIAQALVVSTGGWQSWKTVTVKAVKIEKGTNKLLKIRFSGGYNFNWISFVKSAATDTKENIEDDSYLYPNPANNMFYITKAHGKAQIDISSMAGEVLKSTTVQDVFNSPIDVSELNQGVYYVTLLTEASKSKQYMLVKF